MKTLDLVLKKKWYELIEEGVKTEEYREIKPYWCQRLKGFARPGACPYSLPSSSEERICQMTGLYCQSGISPIYDKVKFRKGRTKESITYEILSMRVGKGKIEWGAPEDKFVFIITLGKKLS